MTLSEHLRRFNIEHDPSEILLCDVCREYHKAIELYTYGISLTICFECVEYMNTLVQSTRLEDAQKRLNLRLF